jgi:predicted 3-demethylubiquinone-9 3-methyltransferase (glyoxalase superfamily)
MAVSMPDQFRPRKGVAAMSNALTQKLSIFLSFQGNAEEAMSFYTSVFEDAEVVGVIRARAEDTGWRDGTLQYGVFKIAGQQVICINAPPPDSRMYDIAPWHDFAFNPAISIYVERGSKEDFDSLYEALIEGGEVYMPADNYGWSPKFAWVNDRYGISWRINLILNSSSAAE